MDKSVANTNHSSSSSTASKTSVKKPKTRSWTGIIFGFLSALSSSFGSVFLKMSDEHKIKVVLLRVLLQFLVLMPVVSYKKLGVITSKSKTNLLLILRGALSPCISSCFALSLSYLPLGDSTAIFYTNPALTVFFACLCLKGTQNFNFFRFNQHLLDASMNCNNCNDFVGYVAKRLTALFLWRPW